MPEPASTWLGLTIPEFGYPCCHVMYGLPLPFAWNRYIRLSETMKTPRCPTAKEFSISSPSFITLIRPVLGSSVPILPFFFETNQIRPLKSGSAEVIRSVDSSRTPVRS